MIDMSNKRKGVNMLKWKDSFSCCIEEVDNQHKKLFEIGNRVYEVASLQDEYDHYDEIMQILDELTEYTIYHFKYEEDLLSEHVYVDFASHKIEHDFFVKKLQRISRRDLESEQNETSIEIVNFVADWVAEHILKSDKAYVGFLNSKGIK